MKIFIVRHGQIPNNVLNRYTFPYEDLTDQGIKQAEELRDQIKDINFDVIFVSPFIRTKHTAKILNVHNTDTIIDDRLQERNCGSLSGQPYGDNEVRNDYWNYNPVMKHGDAESIHNFFARIFNFIDDIKTKEYNKVLVVAHSGVSKAFDAYFNGIKDGLFLTRGLKNCEIKQYEL